MLSLKPHPPKNVLLELPALSVVLLSVGPLMMLLRLPGKYATSKGFTGKDAKLVAGALRNSFQ